MVCQGDEKGKPELHLSFWSLDPGHCQPNLKAVEQSRSVTPHLESPLLPSLFSCLLHSHTGSEKSETRIVLRGHQDAHPRVPQRCAYKGGRPRLHAYDCPSGARPEHKLSENFQRHLHLSSDHSRLSTRKVSRRCSILRDLSR
jgi:hypothetical protein